MRRILSDKDWKVQTTVFWGQRDRWLNYDGVEEFCKDSLKLTELPMVEIIFIFVHTFTFCSFSEITASFSNLQAGHHVQEDCGEELGGLISGVISKSRI